MMIMPPLPDWIAEHCPLCQGKAAACTHQPLRERLQAMVEDFGAPALHDFTVSFDPSLSPEQVKDTLTALSDYFRACGGLGFKVEFEEAGTLAVHPPYSVEVDEKVDLHTEAVALFLRLDKIYAAVDSIAEIERTMEELWKKRKP